MPAENESVRLLHDLGNLPISTSTHHLLNVVHGVLLVVFAKFNHFRKHVVLDIRERDLLCFAAVIVWERRGYAFKCRALILL